MAGTDGEGEPSLRETLVALYQVAAYRPLYVSGVVALSVLAALLEGFGVTFILPIITIAQAGGTAATETNRFMTVFIGVYEMLGVQLTMLNLVFGVALVMSARYTTSFLVDWLRGAIETEYVGHLQVKAFENALDARVGYFDRNGSDDILNAIVTQAEYAGRIIKISTTLIEQGLLSAMYLAIALYISPMLALVALGLLGGLTFLVQNVVEGGYNSGDRVAEAKEHIQSNAQAGTQGIREVKLFGISGELLEAFTDAVDQFRRSQIHLRRTSSAINNFYQLTMSLVVFALIYLALNVASLSLGPMGVFLFAMFRLGPRVSNMNGMVYNLQGHMPHLIRTQQFTRELEDNWEPETSDRSVPAPVGELVFDDVDFAYETSDEQVLRGVSFEVERGEFVAFVGPSGAGKSTIVSLLARMYEPTGGEIRADGVPIDRIDVGAWRERVSLVQQDPHIFNDTLRNNVTVGNRAASTQEVERVCEISRVTEFLDELPSGYDTHLGDDGVKLSGGQRQRVAIARALLKDADLLLLDEATSDLDTSLEQEVHDGIEEMERDFAIVVIAHRLSTVTNANRIHTIEDGEIVETGAHSELLERDGQYARLYSMQT